MGVTFFSDFIYVYFYFLKTALPILGLFSRCIALEIPQLLTYDK